MFVFGSNFPNQITKEVYAKKSAISFYKLFSGFKQPSHIYADTGAVY